MAIYINSKNQVSLIKIDRIRIGGLGLLFKELNVFKSQLQEISLHINKILKYKATKTRLRRYKYSIYYRLENNSAVARIEAGSSKNKQCYVTWEIWPQHVLKSDFALLCECISIFMGQHPNFTYQNVFSIGKVNYLELACDLITPPIHDLIFWKPKTRKGFIYQDKKTNQKGSIYIGSHESTIHFCIYNKAKQLKSKGISSILTSYTRIEARLRKTQLTASELINIPSPFIKLHVASAIDCKKKWVDSTWLQFIANSLKYGYPKAISQFDKPLKKVFQNRLRECDVTFWKPKNLLNNLGDEIAKLHPNNFNFS